MRQIFVPCIATHVLFSQTDARTNCSFRFEKIPLPHVRDAAWSSEIEVAQKRSGMLFTLAISPFFPSSCVLRPIPLCAKGRKLKRGSERRKKILCVSFGLSTIESAMIHTEQRQVAASLPLFALRPTYASGPLLYELRTVY